MIDFTQCKIVPGRAYNGANGSKIAISYNGDVYMLKFPPSAAGKPTELSYTNGCISEHLASSIFNLIGITAQETIQRTEHHEPAPGDDAGQLQRDEQQRQRLEEAEPHGLDLFLLIHVPLPFSQ